MPHRLTARYFRHLWREMSEPGRKTLPWDLVRGATAGAVGSIQMTFALLVAIDYFDATMVQKSIIAGSFSAGLIFSMPYAAWSPILRRKTVRVALPLAVSAVALVMAAYAGDARNYTLWMALYGLFQALPTPVMTGIYRDNYHDLVRGQVFGITAATMSCMGMLAQLLGGKLLNVDLAHYRTFFLLMAFLIVLMATSVLRMPSREDHEPVTPNPFRSLGVIVENPLFGYVLMAWFLFGFANLALQPQRIEYLSQEQYGFDLNPAAVALVVGVTTEIARLSSIQFWAHCFDRFNFIWVRIAMCSLILVHMLIYYHTRSLPVVVFAAALLGFAFGGGAVAWTLWVTKFAPPSETARYMSVHAFFTGIRGAIGPLVGYVCVAHLSIEWTSWLSASLVALSILLLLRIRRCIPGQ